MAIFWRDKYILADLETTYGTDAEPDQSNAILAQQVSLSPMEGNDLDRELELPYFGTQGTTPVELHAKLSFRVELAPSGVAGTPPAWGPLLRACAVAQTVVDDTSVRYNPITQGQEAITLRFTVGNTRFILLGARGTATLDFMANQIPYIQFEFTGIFTEPSEQTRINPVFTAWQRPQEVGPAFTALSMGGNNNLTMRKLMLNLGNQVETRFLVGPSEVLITDKEEQVECTIQAVPLTNFNPFASALNQTELNLSLQHGVGAGRKTTLTMPRAQMQRVQGLETPQNVVEWPLRFKPNTGTGNDQWTLTLT